MREIKFAIFDVDGTILDSMSAWARAAACFLRSRGAVPNPGLSEELLPLGGHQIPGFFKSTYGIDVPPETIALEINAMLEDFYFNRAPLKEGVADVLAALYGAGAKMCVATATGRHLVEPALKRCGVIGYFDRIFTCPEENTGKEHPDIFLRAAEFLGSRVSETFVFEDALYAIKTAKRAGFPVAAVYDAAARSQGEEIKSLADYYLTSFAKWTDVFKV